MSHTFWRNLLSCRNFLEKSQQVSLWSSTRAAAHHGHGLSEFADFVMLSYFYHFDDVFVSNAWWGIEICLIWSGMGVNFAVFDPSWDCEVLTVTSNAKSMLGGIHECDDAVWRLLAGLLSTMLVDIWLQWIPEIQAKLPPWTVTVFLHVWKLKTMQSSIS